MRRRFGAKRARRLVVLDLRFLGVSEDQIRASIQTQVGDPYSRSDIDRDVRSLYGTGLFSNIRVIENSNELGFTLTYIVKEKTAAQVTPQTFENQGMATPEAAFQTFLWAAKNGDSNLVSQMLRWRKEKEDAVSDERGNLITMLVTRRATGGDEDAFRQ